MGKQEIGQKNELGSFVKAIGKWNIQVSMA